VMSHVAARSKYISLFSGGGGLDLALRIALPQARCVCYVEDEITVASILAARIAEGSLDDAPIWSDVRRFDGRPWRGKVDGIIGGFPCQDLSVAGKRAGIQGKRSGLWAEFARITREVRPGWVFIENVPGLLANKAMRRVLGDLSALGFDAEWMCVRASDVGAPHKRERVFILAYSPSGGCGEMAQAKGADWQATESERSSPELAHSGHRGVPIRPRHEGRTAGQFPPERAIIDCDCTKLENAAWDGERGQSRQEGRLRRGRCRQTSSRLVGSEVVHAPNSGRREKRGRGDRIGKRADGDRREADGGVGVAGEMVADATCQRCDGTGAAGAQWRPEPPDCRLFPPGPAGCGRHGCDLRFHKRKLNPLFVAWLMGWPIWWCITEPMPCAHSEMESYLCRQRSRLHSLLDAGGTDEPKHMD